MIRSSPINDNQLKVAGLLRQVSQGRRDSFCVIQGWDNNGNQHEATMSKFLFAAIGLVSHLFLR